ncbi:MAG: WD40 repeat domain-containing protein [Planctomycetota bacterium]
MPLFLMIYFLLTACVAAIAISQPPDPWKTQIRDGVYRIGRIPDFFEIGGPKNFGVDPLGRFLAFGKQKEVILWDLKERRISERLAAEQDVIQLAFSSDGKLLASASQKIDERGLTSGPLCVRIWDLTSRRVKTEFQFERPGLYYPARLRISPDNQLISISTVGSKDSVSTFSVDSGKPISTIDQLPSNASGFCFQTRDTILIPNATAQAVDLWDINVGKWVAPYIEEGLKPGTTLIERSPNRSITAVGGRGGVTFFKGGERLPIKLPPEIASLKRVFMIRFSPDSKHVALWHTSKNQVLYLLDTQSWNVTKKIPISGTMLSEMHFSYDSRNLLRLNFEQVGLASTPVSGNLVSGNGKTDLKGLTAPATALAFTPDGKSVLAGSRYQGRVLKFDLSTGKPKWEVGVRQINRLKVGPNNRFAIAEGSGSEYRLIDLAKPDSNSRKSIGNQYQPTLFDKIDHYFGKPEIKSEFGFSIQSLSFSTDGKQLISAGAIDQQARFCSWNMETQKDLVRSNFKLMRLLKDRWTSSPLVSAAPTDQLAVIATGPELTFLDFDTREILLSEKLDANVNVFRWSPDAKQLLVRTYDFQDGEVISRWQVTFFDRDGSDWKPIPTQFRSAEFCGDGSRVIFSGYDGIEIFETENWTSLFRSRLATYPATLSDDGTKLAFGREDCLIEVWDLSQMNPN